MKRKNERPVRAGVWVLNPPLNGSPKVTQYHPL